MPHYARNQHYVPQFYLKGFASGNYAWVARRDKAGLFGSLFKSNISNLCSQRDCYEVMDFMQERTARYFARGSLENTLSALEGCISPFLRNIVGAGSLQELHRMALESFAQLKLLVGNLMMRNPIVINPSRIEAPDFASMMLASGKITDDELETLNAEGHSLEAVTEYAIMRAELFSLADGSPMRQVITWLDDAGVMVLRARVGTGFVTSDVPIVMGWRNYGSDIPDFLYAPLDWRTAVVFHTCDQRFRTEFASEKAASMWNQLLMRQIGLTSVVISKTKCLLQYELDNLDDGIG